MKDWIKKNSKSFAVLKNGKGFQGLILFAVIIIGFHLLYKFVEPDIIAIPFISGIAGFLTDNLLITTSWILKHLFAVPTLIEGDVLELPNRFSIEMQFGCSGFQQFLLVIILFLFFPGYWQYKIWYIPLSVVVIHVLNIIRFVGISLYSIHHPTHFGFVHDWIFRPFIYLVIFFLWVLWAEVINKKPGSVT